MPDKPLWCGNLTEIVRAIEALPCPWIDRATLQQLLGVGIRRAQQILQGCAAQRLGNTAVASRETLVRHLRALASGEAADYERRRRVRLGWQLDRLRRAWIETSPVLVEAPAGVVNQRLSSLPPGVSVRKGEIRVEFATSVEALEKLLALAMAIGNDLEAFRGLLEE